MKLEGKKVLVVGGGSGIGYAVAEAALADGAEVLIASSNPARLDRATDGLGKRVEARQLDVTDEAQVEAFFGQVGELDHIVTTAGDWGGARGASLAELDLDAAASLFNVRFWGALCLAKHGGKVLAEGGSITLTDGMIAHKPRKGSSVSSAMAGAVEHLTRALAVELAPLRVNAVCPGLIRTGIWDSIPADRREATMAKMTSRLPIARVGTAQEAAQAYLYLMQCGYVTGQVLQVDGGSSLA
ncbi:MAG: SDR family oxidoreductase [Myxococcales bacterium]|nr:SDR family oxidoreductase [Myxococcales bacterium]MDD9969081.1 SDR family oxidoreductase [Myxococcales bacterium]